MFCIFYIDNSVMEFILSQFFHICFLNRFRKKNNSVLVLHWIIFRKEKWNWNHHLQFHQPKHPYYLRLYYICLTQINGIKIASQLPKIIVIRTYWKQKINDKEKININIFLAILVISLFACMVFMALYMVLMIVGICSYSSFGLIWNQRGTFLHYSGKMDNKGSAWYHLCLNAGHHRSVIWENPVSDHLYYGSMSLT